MSGESFDVFDLGATMNAKSVTARATVVVVLALVLTTVMVGVLGGTTVKPAGAAGAEGAAILAKAASQAGLPYCDGGGGPHGPSHGQGGVNCESPTAMGYDCMSLSQYAVYQAIGVKVPLAGSKVETVPGARIITSQSALKPGDVVFFGNNGITQYAHDGIYAGNGMVWDANVKVGLRSVATINATNYLYIEGIRYRSAA